MISGSQVAEERWFSILRVKAYGQEPCCFCRFAARSLQKRGRLRGSAFNGSGPITTGFQLFCSLKCSGKRLFVVSVTFRGSRAKTTIFFDRFIARGLQKPVVCLAAPLMAADR